MSRYERVRFAAMALFVIAAATAPRPSEAQYAGTDFRGFPAPGYDAVGARDDGSTCPGTWLGGDGSFLTTLPNGTIFAAFSDSSIGPAQFSPPPCDLNGGTSPCQTAGAIRAVPNRDSMGNTIAIVSFEGRVSRVRYYFRGDPGPGGLGLAADCRNPRPVGARSFFPVDASPPEPPMRRDFLAANCRRNARIWPRKAIVIGAHLYVFGNFVTDGGRVENTVLIRVVNPNDPPPRWSLEYLYLGCFDRENKRGHPFWATGKAAPCFFGNEAFLANDPENPGVNYLYTYGTYFKGGALFNHCPGNGFTVFPMRIPVADVEKAKPGEDIAAAAQYAPSDTGKGRWLPGLYDAEGAAATGGRSMVVVGDDTNFASLAYSIRPNLKTGLWQAIYNQESTMASRRQLGNPAYRKLICLPPGPTDSDPGGYMAFLATSRNPFGPFNFDKPTPLFAYPGLWKSSKDEKNRSVLVNDNLALESYGTREVPQFAPDEDQIALMTTTAGPLKEYGNWIKNTRMYTPLKYLTTNPLGKAPADTPDPPGELKPVDVGATPRPKPVEPRSAEKLPDLQRDPKVIRSVPSRPGP